MTKFPGCGSNIVRVMVNSKILSEEYRNRGGMDTIRKKGRNNQLI